MSEMGLHDPFEHITHKLWPKEGPRVKLAIWLPTIKSRKSSQFLCVQVVCDIPLESFWRGLQLCLRFHLNQRFAHKVMGAQSCESPNYGNFGHLGVPRQNNIWVLVSWVSTKYIIRGKVMAFPKPGPWWVLWVWVCPWLVLAPKVFQLCSNQLVWFCAGPCEWVIACHIS
jgi:hypothetical protein